MTVVRVRLGRMGCQPRCSLLILEVFHSCGLLNGKEMLGMSSEYRDVNSLLFFYKEGNSIVRVCCLVDRSSANRKNGKYLFMVEEWNYGNFLVKYLKLKLKELMNSSHADKEW